MKVAGKYRRKTEGLDPALSRAAGERGARGAGQKKRYSGSRLKRSRPMRLPKHFESIIPVVREIVPRLVRPNGKRPRFSICSSNFLYPVDRSLGVPSLGRASVS